MNYFDNKRILITGGTGSWGQTLVKTLLKNSNVNEILCFSRGELQQVLMQRTFKDTRIKFIIGDIRDYSVVKRATKDINIVFHMAALKHVPVCEDNPQEAIKTNIDGTTNIINASIENNVDRVIDVSTDKAVEPVNLYGMTKAVGEKLILQANDLTNHTKFICVRGGNVLGSNGSVVPLFINQIKNNVPITITDKKMTRFFLTLDDAIGLVLHATEVSKGGEIFVMNMPSFYIKDVAERLIEHYGSVPIEYIGAKPGEKLDEILISKHEAPESFIYDENYYVILPTRFPHLRNTYKSFAPFDQTEFSSQTKIYPTSYIDQLLKKGGFI